MVPNNLSAETLKVTVHTLILCLHFKLFVEIILMKTLKVFSNNKKTPAKSKPFYVFFGKVVRQFLLSLIVGDEVHHDH